MTTYRITLSLLLLLLVPDSSVSQEIQKMVPLDPSSIPDAPDVLEGAGLEAYPAGLEADPDSPFGGAITEPYSNDPDRDSVESGTMRTRPSNEQGSIVPVFPWDSAKVDVWSTEDERYVVVQDPNALPNQFILTPVQLRCLLAHVQQLLDNIEPGFPETQGMLVNLRDCLI